MDDKDNKCPCQPVRDVLAIVQEHEERLNQHETRLNAHDDRLSKGDARFTEIITKLNFILAILGAVGVAVCGAIANLLFGG